MATGDFHLHSTASDGVHTPAWVMERAAANGVRVLSLTDHDTTAGLAEAQSAADRLGLRLVPGLEMSTDLGKADVHLLAYGFDVASKPLQEFLSWQREGRMTRVRRIVEILRDNGMAIEVERVLEIAGEATVGRPHVARALLERGHVASVQEAFDLWLGNGKAADVDREKLDARGRHQDRPRERGRRIRGARDLHRRGLSQCGGPAGSLGPGRYRDVLQGLLARDHRAYTRRSPRGGSLASPVAATTTGSVTPVTAKSETSRLATTTCGRSLSSSNRAGVDTGKKGDA